MTGDEEIRRGRDAERVLAEPILAEAFDKIEGGLLEQLRRVALGDEKAHHTLIATLQTVGAVKQHIRQVITTGQMAEISKKESLARRALNKFTR